MGNQVCSLPEGDGGKALRDMSAPKRIPSADSFWCELLKVTLPGIELPAFFDSYYATPEALDGLVRNEYFLQLVATNEHSGNFRTFLRFWARLLHHCRTSPSDAAPCSAASLLSLSLLCRCLLKHFAESFSAPELIFQLEQVPCTSIYPPITAGSGEPLVDMMRSGTSASSGSAAPELPSDAVRVSYRGFHHIVRLPFSERPSPQAREQATQACLQPFMTEVPEDAQLLSALDRCGLRDIAAGETFAARDALEKATELDSQELVVCPCAVPQTLHRAASSSSEAVDDVDGRCHSGVVRSVFRGVVDFLGATSFGAVSGVSPSLLPETSSSAFEGEAPARNLSVSPEVLHLQVLLLEVLLTLAAVVAPRYGIAESEGEDAPQNQGMERNHQQQQEDERRRLLASLRPAPTRANFVAPHLFTIRPRGAVAEQLWQASGLDFLASRGEKGSNEELFGFTPVDRRDLEQETEARAGTNAPSRAHQQEDSENEDEYHLSVALPPRLGEPVGLPFVRCLLEVLEESPEQDGRWSSDGATASAGLAGSTAERRVHRPRAEVVLSTLLNAIWLEPHAGSFAKPPKEVLRLLTGISTAPAAPSIFFSTGEKAPSGSDDRAAAKRLASAATRLAARASVVLLLILFYETESHPRVARAFASLTDPLFEHIGPGMPAHHLTSAPLNFAMLLRAILSRLQQGHGTFALLLYSLVNKNVGFRRFCLCRDAAEVLLPILEALNTVPSSSSQNKQIERATPYWAMALLLSLVSLTGDKSLCESASRTELPDSGQVLGKARPITKVSVSSLVVIVVLRLGQWNFASCKDAFFNRAVAAVLTNVAQHDIEHLHWMAASRTLDLAHLLARNALKDKRRDANQAEGEDSSEQPPSSTAERRRSVMIQELLRALVRVISGCLKLPGVIRNCSMVYALQRAYPDKFADLEEDEELGALLRHTRAVMDWFEAQCPAKECEDDSDVQIAKLEAAAHRLPADLDRLSSTEVRSPGGFAYAETAGASSYFLPAVWQAASQLLPSNLCWTLPPRGSAGVAGNTAA